MLKSSADLTNESAIQSAPFFRESSRSSLSWSVKVGMSRATPGKLTPFLFSTFPGITVLHNRLPSETWFITSKDIKPSFIKILAPSSTFWNFTPLETGMIFSPFWSLLMVTSSPSFRSTSFCNPLTLILGPERSANIVGLNPEGPFIDFTRSKRFFFSSRVPWDRLILKQFTPTFTSFEIIFFFEQLGPIVAIIFVLRFIGAFPHDNKFNLKVFFNICLIRYFRDRKFKSLYFNIKLLLFIINHAELSFHKAYRRF